MYISVDRRLNLVSRFYLLGLLKGLRVTIRHFVGNLLHWERLPTIEYPEQKRQYPPRFLGTHILTQKEDGSVRCTACMLCATSCPADCIAIVAAEHPDPNVEKYPASFEIDFLRCVFCGYCEEACPVDAIRMGGEYEWARAAGSSFILDKKFLMDRPSLSGGVASVVSDEQIKYPHLGWGSREMRDHLKK